LDSSRPKPGTMEETLEGGQGPPWAVVSERERERERPLLFTTQCKNGLISYLGSVF
jgi:hypothetical protein